MIGISITALTTFMIIQASTVLSIGAIVSISTVIWLGATIICDLVIKVRTLKRNNKSDFWQRLIHLQWSMWIAHFGVVIFLIGALGESIFKNETIFEQMLNALEKFDHEKFYHLYKLCKIHRIPSQNIVSNIMNLWHLSNLDVPITNVDTRNQISDLLRLYRKQKV